MNTSTHTLSPTDDLRQRCAEILEWQRTGVLKGSALWEYAARRFPGQAIDLQMAEAETAREAYALIAGVMPAEQPARLHCYALSFSYARGNSMVQGCSFIGWETEGVTMERIQEARAGLGFPPDACLIAASYLGHFTEVEMKGMQQG